MHSNIDFTAPYCNYKSLTETSEGKYYQQVLHKL